MCNYVLDEKIPSCPLSSCPTKSNPAKNVGYFSFKALSIVKYSSNFFSSTLRDGAYINLAPTKFG
ncbi:hypothetical protein V1477_018326 [Vespula maculifrons]|uniref:Uncharacterized protein n=1 Tax=Vespula maculifrons TaxID=7453 RepID=A0ABD2AZ49_VESMC